MVLGCHGDDCAEYGKDSDVAWYSIKPDLPYWRDELFLLEELQIFLLRFVILLRERGYACKTVVWRGLLNEIHLRHPDWPRSLSIVTQDTQVGSDRRYEIHISITRDRHVEVMRRVVVATDGPDTVVTAERLMAQLQESFFLPSVG